jgi:hypothetical protein
MLERIVSRPHRAPRRALGRLRMVLVVAFGAAVLLVPAAVGFHRQLLDLVQSQPTVYADDLPGAYSATVVGLVPASQNGRWTISFTAAFSQIVGPRGGYSLSHDRRLVARGEYSFQYSTVGLMVQLRDLAGPQLCRESIIRGNYLVSLKGPKLTLVRFDDRCGKRRVILADRTFVRGT